LEAEKQAPSSQPFEHLALLEHVEMVEIGVQNRRRLGAQNSSSPICNVGTPTALP
jgi:hypothetical protein